MIASLKLYVLTVLYADLNTFMQTLDSRYNEKTSREGGTVAKKVRKEGSPSNKRPPVDAGR